MKKPKGQIFLMSILILSVVLTAGIVLMAIFIRDLKQATETSASVEAFYAADSAMEWQLYNTFNDPDLYSSNLNGSDLDLSPDKRMMTNETHYEWKNEYSTKNKIQTIGIAGNTRRGIEANF
jgi:uncharacterized alpha/beta hydrolase family protein